MGPGPTAGRFSPGSSRRNRAGEPQRWRPLFASWSCGQEPAGWRSLPGWFTEPPRALTEGPGSGLARLAPGRPRGEGLGERQCDGGGVSQECRGWRGRSQALGGGVLGRKAKRLQPEVSYGEEEAATGEWALCWELGMRPGQAGKE